MVRLINWRYFVRTGNRRYLSSDINAINAIANGGYRVRPSIVDRVIDEKGELVSMRPSERVRIMSPQTAEAVANAFEGVVQRGTGRKAALQGYRAAGKTGTAQKIVNGSTLRTSMLPPS